ncbi:polysaccharide deacetylase family protein [Clostridium intestinale]|uniref:Peptidoglycan/xylan/chitin deacetylase, PgdA/CDA1 family n=1 Tax=Clostridium intestinale DSM 6191 TaxID=1121320 RepID=A0A1M5UW69_9CLOT|nr:polysaccharide deacetylase family protein [Clostridium intestinale]SHH67184.1 Peptidoglycan/xylan/chitin deacetylase, PgdA/CDA1 family [Clostridium intestinale DSM 6191]
MRKNNINKRRKKIGIFICSLIIILGAFITYKYSEEKTTQKNEILQASIDNETDNSSDNSEQKENDEDNKDDDSENKNNINMDENSFDAGQIQDFLVKNIKIQDGKKIAYLTFDDGPSTTVTPKILKILKDNNIKATFFIVGDKLEENPETKNILLDIYKQGHAIANHTYTHNYSKLYPQGKIDANTFMGELEQTNDAIKKVLGDKFNTRVVRFPGGHASWGGREEIDNKLEEKKYKYIDWNALIGDAEGSRKTKEQLLNRYRETFVGQEKLVLLMHDTYSKESTAEALQDIITDLKNKGYEFKTLK